MREGFERSDLNPFFPAKAPARFEFEFELALRAEGRVVLLPDERWLLAGATKGEGRGETLGVFESSQPAFDPPVFAPSIEDCLDAVASKCWFAARRSRPVSATVGVGMRVAVAAVVAELALGLEGVLEDGAIRLRILAIRGAELLGL